MVTARTLESKLASLYKAGKIVGGVYIGPGQEAISASIGSCLTWNHDIFAPLIRDQGGRTAFGEPMLDATRSYLGSVKGPSRGRDGNIHRGHPKEGLPAMITLDAFPGKKYPAIVRRIAPYVLDLEKQARTVDVEVSFTDIEGAGTLLVGYSADVEIILDTRGDVLRVPTEALLEGHQVLVFEDGTLDRRSVGAGLENWEFTEVQSGLEAGDRVVLNVDRDGVEDGAYVVEKPSTLRDE